MNVRLLVLAAVGCGVWSGVARASDWPQWMGPQRTGVSQEKSLLKEWPKDGPKLLWHVKDLGYGFGSVAVSTGRIYLLCNEGKDSESVVARSAKDGGKLWSTRLGKVGNPDQQPNYPAARSTPTVDGGFVYALSSDGDIACVEAVGGKLRWKKSLRTDFGGVPGIWAYSESPLVDGNKVVVTPGGPGATIVALNKKTGDVIWKSAVPGGDRAGYASAVVAEAGGVRQYVQFLGNGLVGVDAATGKFLWRYDKTAETKMGSQIATPVLNGSLIYTGTNMVGGGLARLETTGGAIEAKPVYFAKKLPGGTSGYLRVGDYLYGTVGPSLLCVDFATGDIKWQDRGVGAGSLCAADGRLYVHGENGEVALVEATSQGYHEKGRFSPPEQPDRSSAKSWNYPIIANGRLYVRDLGVLYCYDIVGTK